MFLFFAFQLIFFSCGFPAADMTLGFVLLQNFFYFKIKTRTIIFEFPRQIFMYGAFADSEMCGGGTNGISGINHIFRYYFAPLFFCICTH